MAAAIICAVLSVIYGAYALATADTHDAVLYGVLSVLWAVLSAVFWTVAWKKKGEANG